MTAPMNSQNFPDSDLSRHLARKADQFDRLGGSPLDIGQVLDRAGEIKRGRRMRATMVMAAAVLAVAVPTALIASNHDSTREPIPAPPNKVDHSPLSLLGLDTGAAPETGWVDGGTWHPAGGPAQDVSSLGRVYTLAPVGESVLLGSTDDDGEGHASLLTPTGSTTLKTLGLPLSGDVASSDDGELAAFVQPDGTPVVVQEDGTLVELPRIPRGSDFDAVAVAGSGCEERGKDTCTVLVTAHGEKPMSWVSSSTGYVGEHEQMSNLVDVFEDKLLAGYTEITDSGSCSVVESLETLEEGSSWTTCDHSFGTFSPDGKHLSAFPAYLDGAGSSELAVLDADTGAVVLDLHTTQEAFVQGVVWEDDEHLLAVVGEGQRAAILRIALDGSREYAVPPTATEPYETPFVLPSR